VKLFVLLSFGFSLFLGGCFKVQSDSQDRVIARVNGESVPLREFQVNFLQLKSEQDEIAQKNLKLLDDLKVRALNEVIIITLIRQEANKRKVVVAKEEVEGRLANWKDSYPVGGWDEMLRKQNTSEDFLRRRIEDQLLIEKVTTELFAAETRVSDEEMKKFFKTNEHEFTRPERVHVHQILLTVEGEELPQKIRQEILSGKITFESAARKYSQSPDAAKGGDLGFFAKNEKLPAFNEAFALPVGAISKPIKSRFGFHLLKVVEKQLSKKLSFEEAREDITKQLRRGKEVKIYREWVSKLLKDGAIFRNEALFASVS